MSKTGKILKSVLIFSLIVALSGCASANQSSYAKKRRKGSIVNTSQLGRNQYYFSSGYQKKLTKNYNRR